MRFTRKTSNFEFRRKAGWAGCRAAALASILISALALNEADAAPGSNLTVNPALRDLQQLQDDVNRGRLEREIERRQQIRESEAKPQMPNAEELAPSSFRFLLNDVTHTPSVVLRPEEIEAIVKPFLGKTVSMADLQKMLDGINALYREKGYAVCEARLAPQRIRNGKLFITLVEGRTGRVGVEGARHTSEGFIAGALPLTPGEVANYREMSDALVRFNMTHDIELQVDLKAGAQAGTTDYTIVVNEPANWTATAFADSMGSPGTGRYRLGASIAHRSLFGRRDSVNLLGMASDGSQSLMAGYVFPLNSLGTRLSANLSLGEVENGQGGDVKGDSTFYSLRLEHPFYADINGKLTGFFEWSRQQSETSFFGVTINDTQIDACRLGLEHLHLTDATVTYGLVSVESAKAKEKTFNESWGQQILKANLMWRLVLSPSWRASLTGSMQAVLGGDPLMSAQYFYLGNASGVRGYENDFISAEDGAYANVEVSWAPPGSWFGAFAFLDAGRLGSRTPYSDRTLVSAGGGTTIALGDNIQLTGTAAFPLKRHFAHAERIDGVRLDFSIIATW